MAEPIAMARRSKFPFLPVAWGGLGGQPGTTGRVLDQPRPLPAGVRWHIPGAGQRGAEEAAGLSTGRWPCCSKSSSPRTPSPEVGLMRAAGGEGRGRALPAHISSPASLVTVPTSRSVFLSLSLSPPLPTFKEAQHPASSVMRARTSPAVCVQACL